MAVTEKDVQAWAKERHLALVSTEFVHFEVAEAGRLRSERLEMEFRHKFELKVLATLSGLCGLVVGACL